jgi:hypothetical protein
MCQRITCSTCGRPSFAGCGRHVESVLGDVPLSARCACRAQAGGRTAGEAEPRHGPKGFCGLFSAGRDRRRS